MTGHWIRVDAALPDNAKVRQLARLLFAENPIGLLLSRGTGGETGEGTDARPSTWLHVPATEGLLVNLWAALSVHQIDGHVDNRDDDQLEEWARWRGLPGRFAAAFRVVMVSDGVVEGWAEYQGELMARRERWKLRKRAQRQGAVPQDSSEDSSEDVPPAVSPAVPIITSNDNDNAERDTDTSLAAPQRRRSAKQQQRDERDERFAEIKAIYPPRSGEQNWKRARERYNARLDEGHTHDVILAGVQRYRAYVEANDNIGTQFVRAASTFLGPELAFLNPWTPPSPYRANGRGRPQSERVEQRTLEALDEHFGRETPLAQQAVSRIIAEGGEA